MSNLEITKSPKRAEYLYVLPHGIQVVGECAPTKKNPYWRVRIRPHVFFDWKIVSGVMFGRRSRVVAASVLGRPLKRNEHVHHKNEDRTDDSPSNLDVITAAAHNQHHKTGTRKSESSKIKASLSLKRAYAEGRITPRPRIGTDHPQAKLNAKKVRAIRTSGESCVALARRYGVSKQVVLSVIHRRTWSHVND